MHDLGEMQGHILIDGLYPCSTYYYKCDQGTHRGPEQHVTAAASLQCTIFPYDPRPALVLNLGSGDQGLLS